MLYLVRHPPVAKAWQGRCYGQSDPGLSRGGQAMVAPLVAQLAALKPDVVLHSGLRRTRAVAVPLAAATGFDAIAEPDWRERDFGGWEGQSWKAIYRATGNAMEGMLTAPATFRPGGDGETTDELCERVRMALTRLAAQFASRTVVIVSHGGPIACARRHLGENACDLAALIVPPGSVIACTVQPSRTTVRAVSATK